MSNIRPLQLARGREIWFTILRWFDSWAGLEQMKVEGPPKVDWVRSVPFIAVHLMCLGVIWVGWSWTAVAVAVAFYYIRMFAITGWYHRYFSHRTFKTSRTVQLLFALLGSSCAQRGPLWWAGHHRHHHIASDRMVPSLLFPSHVQDFAHRSITLCLVRQLLRSTWSFMVGGPSSSSPHRVRYAGGCAFSASRGVSLVAHGLDHVANVLCSAPQRDRRFCQVSGATVPRPI